MDKRYKTPNQNIVKETDSAIVLRNHKKIRGPKGTHEK